MPNNETTRNIEHQMASPEIKLILDSGIFHVNWYVNKYSSLSGVTDDPWKHFLTHGIANRLDPSPLFCTKYYTERYPDVAESGYRPLEHFLLVGGSENRSPHPLVAPKWLRRNLKDPLPSDNPLLGWLRESPSFGTRPLIDLDYLRDQLGITHGVSAIETISRWQAMPLSSRPSPNPLIDLEHMKRTNQAPSESDPLAHYLLNLGRDCAVHPLVDINYLWQYNPDIQHWDGELTVLEQALQSPKSNSLDFSALFDIQLYNSQTAWGELDGKIPLLHYLTVGAKRGLDPNPFFDEVSYRERYLRDQPEKAGLVHYATWFREPHITLSPRFPDRFYVSRYPEVRDHYDASPLEHYIRFGRREGRRISEPLWSDDFASWDDLRKEIRAQADRLSDAEPEISIIIPVYNQFFYTLRCVWSLLCAKDAARLQVIIADDGSQDETQDFFKSIPNLTYIRNAQNLGFLRSCNNAAKSATAPHLFFLNNDTAVLPGALDALLATARAMPDAGLVGAKLIYPDGTLQEAGGFVWNDGSGANLGRNDDPDAPGYNLRRDADYISGAAILVPRALWNDLGGFDERYVPAYYEDTDLAMRLRQLGWRVVYEPTSQVVHFEGISSGTSLERGVKAYQVVNRDKFLKKWAYSLQKHLPPQHVNAKNVPRSQRPRILFIDHLVPEPDHDAGSVIVASYIRLLLELGYDVAFMPVNLYFNGRYGRMLQAMGAELLYHPHVSNIPTYLQEHAHTFDAFMLWRVNAGGDYMEMLRELCPTTPVIFHTQDLHFLRMQRTAERNGNAPEYLEAVAAMRERELRIMALSSDTVLVSTHEKAFLRELGCRSNLSVVPLVLDPVDQIPPRSGRNGIAFVGGFQHTPNVDAVLWFMEEIYPALHEADPDLEVHIVGSKPTAEILAIDAPGVIIHGYVEDLDGFLGERLATIVPLRYGAGIKGKIGSSLAAGVPVVATTLGAEGMDLIPDREILIADDPKAFVAQILRLKADATLWTNLSAAGRDFVERTYSSRVTRERLMRLFAKSGVTPFSGTCPITGRFETRRFTGGPTTDLLCAIPDGANASERVLATALSEIAGHRDLPLMRLAPGSLPSVRCWGEVPVLERALARLSDETHAPSGGITVGRLVLDADTSSHLDALLAHMEPGCTRLLLACAGVEKTPVTRRPPPHRLMAVVLQLEKWGWEVRNPGLARPECAIADVTLLDARRPSP